MLTGRLYGLSPVMSSLAQADLSPRSGSSRPATMRNVVVLPQPEAPSSAKNDALGHGQAQVVDRGERAEALGDVSRTQVPLGRRGGRALRAGPVSLCSPRPCSQVYPIAWENSVSYLRAVSSSRLMKAMVWARKSSSGKISGASTSDSSTCSIACFAPSTGHT